MGMLGVSVFTGMEQSVHQNIEYLQLAANLGYQKVFTSLHIPEADYRTLLSDCRVLLEEAKRLNFSVTADISPRTWILLGIEPSELGSWGIDILRLDYGFSPAIMREMADAGDLRIEVNASSMGENELSRLLATGIDHTVLCAGHNYYPRPDTGLSFELFVLRSQIFRAMKIPVSVFVPGLQHPRGPVFAGLPTVEMHRRMTPVEAVRQLWASGLVDSIMFGDPLISTADLTAVAELPCNEPNPLELRIVTYDLSQEERKLVFAPIHTNRNDAAGYVVRSQESRENHSIRFVPRQQSQERRRGDVTIDNLRYGRYEGELQILQRDLPADEKVNVVGRVIDEDICLLDCLFPGRVFCLREA
ncbi:MAG: DUF871 domain-containing protein [Negativicutes bacterium]